MKSQNTSVGNLLFLSGLGLIQINGFPNFSLFVTKTFLGPMGFTSANTAEIPITERIKKVNDFIIEWVSKGFPTDKRGSGERDPINLWRWFQYPYSSGIFSSFVVSNENGGRLMLILWKLIGSPASAQAPSDINLPWNRVSLSHGPDVHAPYFRKNRSSTAQFLE